MKGSGIFILLFVAIVASIVFFFSVIKGIQRSFGNAPQTNTINASEMKRDQKARMKNVQERQKRLMQDQRQKLRDMQRR